LSFFINNIQIFKKDSQKIKNIFINYEPATIYSLGTASQLALSLSQSRISELQKGISSGFHEDLDTSQDM